MSNLYRSVFDIIGPIMIGPSSSHTAGAVAIGRAANDLFGGIPERVIVHYYGSFAKTHRGHGTDYAITAGVLGFDASDPRVPNSRQIAREQGIDIRFVEESGESPIHHPNTAVLDLIGGDKRVQISGCSIGGGTIEIRNIRLHGIDIKPTGPLSIILYVTTNTERDNGISLIEDLNRLAPFDKKQVLKNNEYTIYEFDLKQQLQEGIRGFFVNKYENIICL
ncbi:serine dehydratase beta chain [Ligilactobacillus salivarius]|uniref:serine dehydratase beta chain n=1 Tax=Ligilactobacillus salivarius TaxID=1624 RepID=UPI003AB471E2